FQAEVGIRYRNLTGVQTSALAISLMHHIQTDPAACWLGQTVFGSRFASVPQVACTAQEVAMSSNEQQVSVDGHRLTLTNLDKVYYPETGTTKGEVLDYYARIAPYLIPHAQDRIATRK